MCVYVYISGIPSSVTVSYVMCGSVHSSVDENFKRQQSVLVVASMCFGCNVDVFWLYRRCVLVVASMCCLVAAPTESVDCSVAQMSDDGVVSSGKPPLPLPLNCQPALSQLQFMYTLNVLFV